MSGAGKSGQGNNIFKEETMAKNEVDEAVFRQVKWTQTYQIDLYQNGVFVGKEPTDCLGTHVPEKKEELKKKYPNIKIRMA